MKLRRGPRRAQAVADRLQAKDQDRRDVREFRRLADMARYYAATTDPVAESAPYFDPQQGEARALAALAITSRWGPTLERLLLPDEIDPLKRSLHDLLLLTAQAMSQHTTGPDEVQEMLACWIARPCWVLRPGVFSGCVPSPSGDAATLVRRPTTSDGRTIQRFRRPRSITFCEVKTTGKTLAQTGERSERSAWEPEPERMEKAIEEYRQALRIDPEHYWSQFQLGRSYLSLSRLAEAVAAHRRLRGPSA